MKKLLALCLTAVLCLCCLTACELFEKDKGVTVKKYENCAVFTFDDFPLRETASFELERTDLGEGAIYYQVNLKQGALGISYKDSIIGVHQSLGEFTADDEMPINGSGGYIEGDKIGISFGSLSPVSGEIIIAFTEDALKAVYKELNRHEHTGEWHTSESTHYYQYTCGCPSPDIAELHLDGDDNGLCDICEYVIGGTATNTGKVQTTIGEEAHLPQFMSLEADKHNALSNDSAINIDVYMGYDILNKDGVAFSDIIVPESDFAEYTFVLEINYNNETRTVALDSLNYFEEYRCDMYQDVVQYSKYNTVQLDTTKMTGKSYGFVNIELYMISNTNERYYVSAETLYYSVTDTEIVFGLVSNPVATEGDPGIITKGWEYNN